MHLQDMLRTGVPAHAAQHLQAIGHPLGHLQVQRAMFSVQDTLFLFIVALVVFGPKRLPEIGKQIGKLVFEFRRASNDFKLQIEEELRLAEQQERQKQLDVQAALPQPATPVATSALTTTSAETQTTASAETQTTASAEMTSAFPAAMAPEVPLTIDPQPAVQTVHEDMPLTIQPPASGLPVSANPPNRPTNVMTPLPPPEEPAARNESEISEIASEIEPGNLEIESGSETAHQGTAHHG